MARRRRYRDLLSWEGLLPVFLLAVLLAVRLHKLEADPPWNLSLSTDVYTDPAQYTLFAKQYVQTGDFNPYDDDRLALFLKSTVTLAALAVFELLGVGIWQSNLVGLLFSFGGLLLFYLVVRRVGGNTAGLVFLLLIGLNYNQVFYGRLPFLEHAMVFWAALALAIVTHCSRPGWFAVAGLALGLGVFFGKVLGLVFLFPFACALLYRVSFEDAPAAGSRVVKPALFGLGFAAVAVVWFFFSYAPQQAEVSSYLGEQTLGLYGVPDALRWYEDFLWNFAWFGAVSKLFSRMPAAALLGAAFLAVVFYHAAQSRSWRKGFGKLTSAHVFVAAAIVGFFLSLMIWNYRPMRYQLVLVYAFCAAASWMAAWLWSDWKDPSPQRTPWLFYVFVFPMAMVICTQLVLPLWTSSGREDMFHQRLPVLAVIALVVTLWSGLVISLLRRQPLARWSRLGKVAVLVVLGATLWQSGRDYLGWERRATYTLRDNGRDLGEILSPEAVVSGPFAPAMTLENRLGVVIHMFGVAGVDSTLFERFPVTHLLLDQPNEDRARQDHVSVMGLAPRPVTYHVGNKKVRLYRIAGRTGSIVASRYRRSDFEIAADGCHTSDVPEEARRAIARFVAAHPSGISGNLMVAELANTARDWSVAERHFDRALGFSPTNYNLNARLGTFFQERFAESRDPEDRRRGLMYFERAVFFAPDVYEVEKALRDLETATVRGEV